LDTQTKFIAPVNKQNHQHYTVKPLKRQAKYFKILGFRTRKSRILKIQGFSGFLKLFAIF